ncbi:MAG: preprotein translocase subunit SecG, partial [Polyangiales bacterium]
MYTFVSIIYVFVCLFLILVVLLQSGKGGGLGSAFGGGTSQQIFGGAGAGNLLTRLTAIFAFAFMGLSVWLAFL